MFMLVLQVADQRQILINLKHIGMGLQISVDRHLVKSYESIIMPEHIFPIHDRTVQFDDRCKRLNQRPYACGLWIVDGEEHYCYWLGKKVISKGV